MSDAEKRELTKLDLYYKEMENLFIPKFNRRAVGALTGTEGGENIETDFQYKSNKVFMMHTSHGAAQLVNKAVNAKDQTETFGRTDGEFAICACCSRFLFCLSPIADLFLIAQY
jgi:hypothetical protein